MSDVGAGYDIKSFKNVFDKNNKPISIFIEVKVVPIWNYEFYWTKNEIEKAKKYKNKYFLYLLPVKNRNEFDIDNLRIIKNPFNNVYKNNREWLGLEELMSFSLIKK